MLAVLLAMVWVGLGWLLTWVACVGWGRGVLAWRRDPGSDPPSWSESFWVGWLVLLGVLQLWHLVAPVGPLATWLWIFSGWAGFGWTQLGRRWWPGLDRLGWAWVVVAAILLLWLGNRGLDFARNYDSGLYHFAAVRWIAEMPIVPGLANLHERLGFNQSYFLYVAWADGLPGLAGNGYHAANSLLAAVFVGSVLRSAARMHGVADLLRVMLLPVVVLRAMSGDISSPTPDFAVFLLGLVVFDWVVRQWVEGESRTTALIVAGVAGCTIKLSFLFFAAAVLGVIAVRCIMDRKAEPRGAWRKPLWVLLAAIGFWAVPFGIRGGIVSGYPAFPSMVIHWDADWRVPAAEAQLTADWIKSWARAPGKAPAEVLSSWSWLGPWWDAQWSDVRRWPPLAAAVLGLVTLGVSRLRPTRAALPPWVEVGPPLLVLLAAATGWFLSAPDVRFGDWIFWLIAAWCGSLSLSGGVSPRWLARILVGSSVLLVLLNPQWWSGKGGAGFAWLPEVQTRESVSDHGVSIAVPVEGTEGRMWRGPLVSAPTPRPHLERRGQDVADGFRAR